jgi:hypothetical protein
MDPTKVLIVTTAVLAAFVINRMVGLDRMLAAA